MMHFLGRHMSTGNGDETVLSRFARPLTEDEFAPLSKIGLPDGWVAWHIEGPRDRRFQELHKQVPVIVDALDGHVDPLLAMWLSEEAHYERWADLYLKSLH